MERSIGDTDRNCSRRSVARLKEVPTTLGHRIRICSRKGNTHIPRKLALFDGPLKASMGPGPGSGAIFQVAVDVKVIRGKRSLLLLQTGAELGPSLKPIQHCHWLSQGNNLGKPIQLLSPQGCASSIHALQWTKGSSFTEGLPQAIDSKLNLLRLIRTRLKA